MAGAIYGTEGDDILFAKAKGSVIFGLGGDDTFIDGKGNDWFWGGNGADTFIFDTTDAKPPGSHQHDMVQDFNLAEGDVIVIDGVVIDSADDVDIFAAAGWDVRSYHGNIPENDSTVLINIETQYTLQIGGLFIDDYYIG